MSSIITKSIVLILFVVCKVYTWSFCDNTCAVLTCVCHTKIVLQTLIYLPLPFTFYLSHSPRYRQNYQKHFLFSLRFTPILYTIPSLKHLSYYFSLCLFTAPTFTAATNDLMCALLSGCTTLSLCNICYVSMFLSSIISHISSILLSLPPLTFSVAKWLSVARFPPIPKARRDGVRLSAIILTFKFNKVLVSHKQLKDKAHRAIW